MKINTPTKVAALPGYMLHILFSTGENKIFDVKPYLADPFFAPLANEALFKTVRVNPISIEWDGGIDICPDELYLNSTLLA